MQFRSTPLLLLLSSFVVSGCPGSEGDGPPDSGMPDAASDDAGPLGCGVEADAGTGSGTLCLPGLDGPVDVVYDDRGVPHIYGTTRHDVVMVQGYLMSRDRFGQMEFIRRSVLGRLAEVVPASLSDLVDDDIGARFESYGRVGRAMYASLPANDEARLAAEAFVEGINVYIDRVREMPRIENPVVPGAVAFNIVLSSAAFGHWEPADVFAMAQYQAANLSYDAGPDIRRARQWAAAQAVYNSGASDPRLAAREGFLVDMLGERPARAVFTRDGVNDGTTRAIVRPRPGRARDVYVPNLESLDRALPFLDRMERRSEAIFGDVLSRGSNNWVVAAEHTANDNPLLANDPHLSLISPPVWWYVHLNTTRMGATGDQALNVQGVAFAGLPGVVIGFNDHIAWGVTTTGYDVTDVYEERLTGTCDSEGNVTGGTVLFNGNQVPVQFYDEEIAVAGEATPRMVRLAYVPHHGLISRGSCAAVTGQPHTHTALSIRYTGWETPHNELQTFLDLSTATDVDQARAALDSFEVGSQNFMIIDRDDIFWSTQSRIPIRDPRARDLMIDASGAITGLCPNVVLPGTGEYEWTGDLDDTLIPHDLNPARGFMATANQDNIGTTADGNVCNDPIYVGNNFDFGWRQGRIVERLTALVARGDVTLDDMVALQAESQSPLGRTMRDPIVQILRNHSLTLSTEDQARVTEAIARLEAWTDFETDSGYDPLEVVTDPDAIADSIATTIFNAAITRIVPRAFEDEMRRMGGDRPGAQAMRLLEWMLTDPNSLYTGVDAGGESILWDDIDDDSPEVETKFDIVVRGVIDGMVFLEGLLGTNVDEWLWGRLHTVRFETVVPVIAPPDTLSLPFDNDARFPNRTLNTGYGVGYPRHSDLFAVDPGNFGQWAPTRFTTGSGASQRMVVEMTETGPIVRNAIPGGQSADSRTPHRDDEAMLWIRNEQPPIYTTQADIDAHTERTLRVIPMP